MTTMKLTPLPLMGAFHLHYPLYNAVSLRDLVVATNPDIVVTPVLHADAFEDPAWQDTPELALPLAVVPWASRAGVPVYGVAVPSPDPDAKDDFRRYLKAYPRILKVLNEVDAILAPLHNLLEAPLTLPRIRSEVLPLFAEHQRRCEETFGDGPATDWLRERSQEVIARIHALGAERVTLLASAEHLPTLEAALDPDIGRVDPPEIEVSEQAYERSLLDLAMQVTVPEPGNVIQQLRELDSAEARYHEANLMFANGHLAEALELLEHTSQGDFSQPYFLPGYLLARLGLLRDLAGRWAQAERAYRGVLALEYAPSEAREAAREGLDKLSTAKVEEA